jgi:hypothetical protein
MLIQDPGVGVPQRCQLVGLLLQQTPVFSFFTGIQKQEPWTAVCFDQLERLRTTAAILTGLRTLSACLLKVRIC